MSHHRERDMAMPTMPVTHFIVSQTGLALGLLDTLLNCVAGGSHLRQFPQGGVGRRIGQVIGEFRRIVDGTPRDQPGVWSWQPVAAFHHLLAGPVVGDQPFLPFGDC